MVKPEALVRGGSPQHGARGVDINSRQSRFAFIPSAPRLESRERAELWIACVSFAWHGVVLPFDNSVSGR